MLLSKKLPKSFAIFVRSSYGDLLMVDPLIKYIKQLNSEDIITLDITRIHRLISALRRRSIPIHVIRL